MILVISSCIATERSLVLCLLCPCGAMTREGKIMQLAKGMRGRVKHCYKLAIRRVEKGLKYAYKGRKIKKRITRQEWIGQLSAGAREHGMVYSSLIQGCRLAAVGVDRKMMAVLAQKEPYSFRAIVEEAKAALRKVVLRGPARELPQPSIVPDAAASTQVDRGIVPRYEGPPLPDYPRRYKTFS